MLMINIWKSIADLGKKDKVKIVLRHYVWGPFFDKSGLFNRSIVREIIEYYDGYQKQNADSRRGSLGLGFVHYAWILNTRPDRILCIGSKKGFIPALCAMACKHIGHGQVDFVDAGYGEQDGKKQWGGIALWKRQNPDSHFSFLGLSSYITVYVMTTEQFFKKNPHRYQYIYIDGDHSYNGVKRDYNLSWPRLDSKGYMAFHDTYQRIENRLSYGVWRFWKELKQRNKIDLHVAAGLGIIQKD